MKGISNLLGLLMVAVISIAIFLAVSGVVGGFLARQTPKGNDLVLTGFVWWWEYGRDGKTIIDIKGNAVDVGSEAVNITGVYVVIGGTKYKVEYFGPRVVRPNNVAEIVGYVKAPIPQTSLMTVIVTWCGPEECSESVVNAHLSESAFSLDYGTATITETIPITMTAVETVTATATATKTVTATQTITTTVPATATTVTATATVTTTRTTTVVSTTTTTTTTTVTTPAWLVSWTACYDITNNIYVEGTLMQPVNVKGSIPYVVRFYECNIFGQCTLLAEKPFAWIDSKSFSASYYLPNPKPFHSYKVEIWSVDWGTGQLIAKVYEQVVDFHYKCA